MRNLIFDEEEWNKANRIISDKIDKGEVVFAEDIAEAIPSILSYYKNTDFWTSKNQFEVITHLNFSDIEIGICDPKFDPRIERISHTQNAFDPASKISMEKFHIRIEEKEKIQETVRNSIKKIGRVYCYELLKISPQFRIWTPESFWTDESKFKYVPFPFPNGGEGYILHVVDPSQSESANASDDFDPVSKPSHYTEGRKYEPRKVIHDWGLDFNLGNAVKYISRAGRKNDVVEDLKKAIQYIEFELEELENEKE